MDDMASVGLKVDSTDVRKASGDLDKFAKSGDQAGGSAGRATGAIGGMSAKMVVAAAAAAALAAAFAAGKFLNKFVDATVEAEKAQAQLGAAILSTGGAAGKSVSDLNRHAAALQKITNFGDEATNEMQGLLLTFTQIKGVQFDAATTAVMDLATAMGTDLKSAALQVGKALNDPVLGMTALSRSGIQFTEAQKEMVKGMVAANDTIGAQTIILAELEKQFGGSAEAARNTLGGALASLGNAFGDVFEIAGPASDQLRASIEGLIVTVTDPRFVQALQNIGALLFSIAGVALEVVAGLGLLVGAVSAFFAFETATTRLAQASDTANLAIADEIAQINALTVSTGAAIAVSEITALNKLREAEAHLASADAKLEEARANIINSDSYQGVIQRIVDTQDALLSMNAESARGAAAYEETEQSLVAMLARQKELLDLIPETSAEYAAAAASVENLRTRITEAKDGTVILGGAVSDAADTTAALARLANGVDFSNAIAGAVRLANTLQISVVAAASLQNLQASINSGGGRGQDPRRFMEGGDLAGNASSAAAAADRIQVAMDAAAAATTRAAKALAGGSGGSGGGGGGGGGGLSSAASAAAKDLDAVASEIERLEFEADPVKKYTAEIAKLDKLLAGGLSDGAYAKAVKDLNEQFSKTSPNIQKAADAIGDFVAGGMRDFGSLLDSFKNMLRQMISTAISNPIKIALTTAFGGAGPAAAGAPGGLGGGGGLLGGLVGSFGTGGGIAGLAGGAGFLGGVGNVLGGLASGGLSGGIGAIGTALGGATSGLAGLATAAGAVALPLLAIVGVFSFFKKKIKELDSGFVATVNGMDTLVQTFRTIETRRFWGLSKKVSTSITAASKETTEAVTNIVDGLQASVLASADALGIAGSTFDNFAHTIRISTKGLSEEAANKAIQDALLGMADAMAGMVGGLSAFATDGEGAAATLERLALSLVAVNGWMGNFRMNLYDVSLAGGGAAAAFVQLFGSLENFNAVSQSYYQNFFTDAERVARATELLSIEMLALGINTLPSTRAAFRALVDEADALGDSGLVASLMQLSPAFAEITAGADALGNSLRSLVNEDLFSTGQDYMRALSRTSNGQLFTPQQSDAELRAELRALNVSMERLVSSSEITAGNTGRGADAADDTLAFQLEQTL